MSDSVVIAPTARSFQRNNRPFFYLADTVWSAFTEAEEEEWREYLRYRSQQGFTVLQITLLPILHDNSASHTNLFPFHRQPDGRIDFFQLNDAYFQRVAAMIEMASQYGLTCALTLLWCNYAPDTWISQQSPEYVMPLEAIKVYVEYVVTLLDRYHPIYVVSGDTDFRSATTIEAYLTILSIVKRLSPASLACLHISPYSDLPTEITASPHVDFYMYQSGHRLQEQQFCYTLAERFYQKEPARPVINSEPCYEGAGYGFQYGRFSAFFMRKTFWQSVLSGASAGFTYGAHGVWSWHRHGSAFSNEDWSKTPFDWRTALRFPGAWDVAFGKWVIERYGAFELVPHQEWLETAYEEIRLAATPDGQTLLIFVPYNVSVALKEDLNAYRFEGINLETRNIFYPATTFTAGQWHIEMAEMNSDCLLIGKRG